MIKFGDLNPAARIGAVLVAVTVLVAVLGPWSPRTIRSPPTRTTP